MGGSARNWILSIALLGIGQECLSSDFFYQSPQHPPPLFSPGARHPTAPVLVRPEPPAGNEMSSRYEPGLGRATTTPARRGTFVAPQRPALDLRPPALRPESDVDGDIPFPSRPHSVASSEPSGNAPPEFHFQGSRVKQFAERFHHEGLPVARLWETHSALLSLGLNQRGKPGLWLIQKTH
jgi:hypothetical protein